MNELTDQLHFECKMLCVKANELIDSLESARQSMTDQQVQVVRLMRKQTADMTTTVNTYLLALAKSKAGGLDAPAERFIMATRKKAFNEIQSVSVFVDHWQQLK